MKRIGAILLSLALLLSALPGAALGAESVISISTAEEFVKFAQDCTLDSYSQGKSFLLTADIDLTGQDLTSVPLFCGAFDGGGHTISGLSITGDGSHQGLFRYVAEGAQIKNLTVSGAVTPGGTGCAVGGIAGSNSGTLLSCRFTGVVSGVERVGGIAGENTSTGVITSCSFSGTLTGEHEAGGVTGSNEGVLLDCTNDGAVNTVPVSATSNTTFDISSLSEEDFVSVINIGGIAGESSGVIQSCENRGSVGYEHLGYNVGGIAGKTGGSLSDCTNSGTILGRRDVGGIAGQLEPYAIWDFSDSKLADLEEQMNRLNSSVVSAVEQLAANVGTLTGELQAMLDYAHSASTALGDMVDSVTSGVDSVYSAVSEAANLLDSEAAQAADRIKDTIGSLLPEESAPATDAPEEDGETPAGEGSEETAGDSGEDAAEESGEVLPEESSQPEEEPGGSQGTLSAEKLKELAGQLRDILAQIEVRSPDATPVVSALEGVYRSASALSSSLDSSASALSEEVADILDQVDAILAAISETAESLGTIEGDYETDLSVSLAYSQDTGAISQCVSYGEVQADTNAGGIAGSVAFEVAFDMEDELNLSGYLFTNARYLIFAVLRDCESYGDITAKKECAGGIVGNLSYGAVLNCAGIGGISVEQGDYAGGIAGQAAGSILNCCSRADLSGGAYVGGIAGWAGDLSGCLSYSFVDSGAEYLGAIAGWAEGTVAENQYVDGGLGGIDGVSRAGIAEPISYEEMLAKDDLPDAFSSITVTFLAEGETVEVVEVPFGGSIDALPEVPNKGEQYWKWDDFNQERIYYSLVVEGKYYNPRSTISTGEEFPLFLAEGTFYEGQTLTAVPYAPDYDILGVPEEEVLAAYTLLVNDYSDQLTLRMRAEEKGALYRLEEDGSYVPLSYRTDGGYLVFSLENGGSIVYVRGETSRLPYFLGGGAGLLVLGGGAFVLLRRRKKKKAAATGSEHP